MCSLAPIFPCSVCLKRLSQAFACDGDCTTASIWRGPVQGCSEEGYCCSEVDWAGGPPAKAAASGAEFAAAFGSGHPFDKDGLADSYIKEVPKKSKLFLDVRGEATVETAAWFAEAPRDRSSLQGHGVELEAVAATRKKRHQPMR